MKLILYRWNSNLETELLQSLEKMGHDVSVVDAPCKNYIKDMELAWQIIQVIQRYKIEGIISINYFPVISSVCEITHIPYYSWVYDCPHYTLFAHQAKLEFNKLFVFDKALADRLHKYGVTNVVHQPLAVNVDSFDRILEDGDKLKHKKYTCDVSFVGSMYTGSHNYYDDPDLQSQLQTEEKVLAQQFISSAMFAYGKTYEDLYQRFLKRKPFLQALEDKSGVSLGKDFYADASEVVMSSILEKKVTVEERAKLMSGLAQSSIDFRIYTNSDLEESDAALRRANFGTVDYLTEMPFVFHNSKININNTLKSIHSGVSQRILDIMACGGFVLTNAQEELKDYFEIGKEIVTYDSYGDCLAKVKYYLENDKERREIAAAGKRRVARDFAYDKALSRILAES